MTHNLQVALRLAAAGLHVVPADQSRKPTVRGKLANASTVDQHIIRAWWQRYGRDADLVAIDLHKAGLVVIDADRHGGPDGVAAWAALVRKHRADMSTQPTARTPRNGLYIYFSQPQNGTRLGSRRGSLPDGIEVKSTIITAPECVRADSTFYEIIGRDLIEALGDIPPVPFWLADMIATSPHDFGTATLVAPDFTKSLGRLRSYAGAALAGQISSLSDMLPNSGRNHALNCAAFRLGRMAARGWISTHDIECGLRQAARRNGLLKEDGPHSVNATIRSGLSAGLKTPANTPGCGR